MDKMSKVLIILLSVFLAFFLLLIYSERRFSSQYIPEYQKSKYHISKINASEQEDNEIIKILYIGNSNTISGYVPIQVSEISSMYGKEVYFEYIPMMTLNDIIDEAVEEMNRIQYDYVVLQDLSRRPHEEREAFLSDVKILCEESRKNGATPVLYNPACIATDFGPAKEELEMLTDSYKTAAKFNYAILVNAAEAWIYVYDKYPYASLYIAYEAHANDAGAYFTACVFVSTLFDLHVKDVNEDNIYHDEDAMRLGKSAWEFVSYYTRYGSAPTETVRVPDGNN